MSVRDPSFDFEGFRREVEALINDPAIYDDDDSPDIYMAGDSIMANYADDWAPQMGWGQALRTYMKNPAHLHNFAKLGWSARRFRESGRWENCIASKLKKGDWVVVSFAHNDSMKRRNKQPKNDYSTPEEYKAFLAGFVNDVKAKEANIVFATCVPHSEGFSEKDGAMIVDGGASGKSSYNLAPYLQALREFCAEQGLPLIDLNKYAVEELPKLGMDQARSLYMCVKPHEFANYPSGKNDPTHIRAAGAHFYASAAIKLAREQKLGLAELFRDAK